MVFDSSAMTAFCRFCGTKYVLSREDTDFFHDYYSTLTDMITPDRDENSRKRKADLFWTKAETKIFTCVDDTDIEVRFMHQHTLDGVDVYAARRNIVFHFPKGSYDKNEKFRKTVSFIDYPSADTRHLSNFFPNIIGGFSLKDGSSLIVISKDENEYPLRLFSGLSGRHTAWIISRMENLCCVLEYNGLVHPGIGPDTLYINPFLHQANIYGGWWLAGNKNSMSADRKSILVPMTNLERLRLTAANVLGYAAVDEVKNDKELPDAMKEFISGKPEDNAYDDFVLWDKMLIKAYGERKFIDFETDDKKIYGRE